MCEWKDIWQPRILTSHHSNNVACSVNWRWEDFNNIFHSYDGAITSPPQLLMSCQSISLYGDWWDICLRNTSSYNCWRTGCSFSSIDHLQNLWYFLTCQTNIGTQLPLPQWGRIRIFVKKTLSGTGQHVIQGNHAQ